MPIVKVTRNFQVTIPVEVREQLRIELGDLFEATVHNENILLTPKVVVDKKVSARSRRAAQNGVVRE